MIYIALKYDRCGADAQGEILGVYSTRQLAVSATVAHIKKIDPEFEVMDAPGIISVDDEAFIDEYQGAYCNGEVALEIHAKEIQNEI